MNINQAYKILNYGTVPRQREEQIELIKAMSYTKLKGGKLLSECRDRQLYLVAGRLFREAESKVLAELKAQAREMREEEDLIQYHAFLCDRFNIPESQRDNYAIGQLEILLMQ